MVEAAVQGVLEMIVQVMHLVPKVLVELEFNIHSLLVH
jgi:hypothetical protein